MHRAHARKTVAAPRKVSHKTSMSNPSAERGVHWFFKGARGIASLPAIILMSAFVGFCGFAVEAGIPLGETVFMTGMIWALPAKVLLVGSILAGVSLPAAFITVALSSIRLMPMVAALIPEIRTEKTPTWLLLLLSHFIAITAYVFTMERIRDVPREHRVAFFAGFGTTVTSANIVLVAVIYSTVANLPAMVAGALFFLTPVYFPNIDLGIVARPGRRASPWFLDWRWGRRSTRSRRNSIFSMQVLPAARWRSCRRQVVAAGRTKHMIELCETFDAWWWPYAFIAVAGWLATDIWRWLGVLIGNRLKEDSAASDMGPCRRHRAWSPP
jgi:hypothetical protein